MEKTEKEELKDRFMNLVVDDKREKITVKDLTATAMMIRNSPPDYSVLLNFIEKELDKAREEERKNIWAEILFNLQEKKWSYDKEYLSGELFVSRELLEQLNLLKDNK